MTNLQRALENVLTWPYMRKGGTPFEQQVGIEFSSRLNLPIYQHRAPASCPEHIVMQPNGSQMPPDILIALMGFALSVECKSAKGEGQLMWNSGIPDLNTLYLFNCKEGTTALFGDQIIDPGTIQELQRIKDESAPLKMKYDERLLGMGSGWRIQYVRPMFQQVVMERNWLSHERRVARERDAVNRVGIMDEGRD